LAEHYGVIQRAARERLLTEVEIKASNAPGFFD